MRKLIINNSYQQKYYLSNREKIIEKNKKYYYDNKIEILEQKKKYYENSRNDILEQKKIYYENYRNDKLEYSFYKYYKNKYNLSTEIIDILYTVFFKKKSPIKKIY